MTTTTTTTATTATTTTTEGPFRIARVVIAPRDRAALSLDVKAAATRIQQAFGGACIHVSGVTTTETAWHASLVIDATRAKDVRAGALVAEHPGDERLWRSFIESLCTDGLCDVVGMDPPTANAPTPTELAPAPPR